MPIAGFMGSANGEEMEVLQLDRRSVKRGREFGDGLLRGEESPYCQPATEFLPRVLERQEMCNLVTQR